MCNRNKQRLGLLRASRASSGLLSGCSLRLPILLRYATSCNSSPAQLYSSVASRWRRAEKKIEFSSGTLRTPQKPGTAKIPQILWPGPRHRRFRKTKSVSSVRWRPGPPGIPTGLCPVLGIGHLFDSVTSLIALQVTTLFSCPTIP
jgi:hypothetical protein